MMDYTVKDEDQVIDWLPIFEALSTVQFEKFASRLQFPGQVPPELREIAQQFCLAVLTYLATFSTPEYPVPEAPVDPLYSESESIAPLIQMWTNTFAKLKAVEYDELVYKWGQKIQQIEAISRLVTMSDWFGLLRHWSTNSFDPQIALELPDDLITKLKIISQECDKDIRTLYADTTEARGQRRISTNVWEHYVSPFSWIGVNGRDLRELLLLKQIFNLLPPPSLEILDQWGAEVFKNPGLSGYFSLVEFAETLDKSGLDLSEGTAI